MSNPWCHVLQRSPHGGLQCAKVQTKAWRVLFLITVSAPYIRNEAEQLTAGMTIGRRSNQVSMCRNKAPQASSWTCATILAAWSELGWILLGCGWMVPPQFSTWRAEQSLMGMSISCRYILTLLFTSVPGLPCSVMYSRFGNLLIVKRQQWRRQQWRL